jgi:hypothetical protein
MRSNPGRRFVFVAVPLLLLALALLVYPVYIIQPFRAQDPGQLTAALAIMRYRPVVMALAVLTTLAALVWYWRREKRVFRRIVSALSLLAVSAAALLSRVNVYELMFHPLGEPAFSAASASHLDGAEKVIAVNVGGAARAYHIRGMSYHHIVNDTLGGVPIAATY